MIVHANPDTAYGRRKARRAAQSRANQVGHRVYLQPRPFDTDGCYVIADDGRGPFNTGAPWLEFRPDYWHYRGRSIRMIEHANASAGFHFFDPDTLQFFRSRVHDTVYGAATFVTSERPPNGPRRYTVREARPDGSIDTVGEFMAYGTSLAAHAAAYRHAAERREGADA